MAKRTTKSADTGAAGKLSAGPRVRVTRESRPRTAVLADDVLDKRHTEVSYGDDGRNNPFKAFFNGMLPNNDPIVLKYGGWEDVGVYKGMWRRHPWLVGICDQAVERANIPRVIVAGDTSDTRSTEIANAVRFLWEKVPEKPTVTGRWLKYAKFLGYAGVEKVFARDPHSGLIYPAKLIARESENIKQRDDGAAMWLSRNAPSKGEVIPPRKMMFLRGGTNDTFYGEAELQHVYPITYWLEKSIELLFDSVEEFGRAVPHIRMPRERTFLSQTERGKVRAWAKAYHRNYVETPYDGTRVEIEMLGANVAASGGAGRPEQAIIDTLIAWAYVRVLRVVQTLNRTGSANGSLETTRTDITDDASVPNCLSIDDGLNARAILPNDHTGWIADVCDLNFPNEADEILPRFKTTTLSPEAVKSLHEMSMELIDRNASPSKKWYFQTMGIEEATGVDDRFGEPLTRISKTETQVLTPEAAPPPADPQQQNGGAPQ